MFKLKKQSGRARRGLLQTRHGSVETPNFMAVATRGVLKHLSTEEAKQAGAQILLSNTYHLMLRPGADLVKKAGGLHKFMNWSGPILTDSGGFQIFSLAQSKRGDKNLVKLNEAGVSFKSHIDGSSHFLTPERALALQCALGVDIAVCLDECVALPAERAYIAQSVELTTAWAKRTKIAHNKLKGDKPLLFAVVQGGLDKKLRLQSLQDLTALDFDGYNIGGLSVGETARDMYKVLDWLTPQMPADKTRYLMGVGYPENIVQAVKRGVDLFDCVIPTREGRHGRLFVFKPNAEKIIAANLQGQSNAAFYTTINLHNAKHTRDFSAINASSAFSQLQNLSKAYLHHLFKIEEPLAARLASLHNLEFYWSLMNMIRKNI